jgi:hypothetical protein
MKHQSGVRNVRVTIQMVNAAGVEGRRAPDHAMDFISLAQQ